MIPYTQLFSGQQGALAPTHPDGLVAKLVLAHVFMQVFFIPVGTHIQHIVIHKYKTMIAPVFNGFEQCFKSFPAAEFVFGYV